MSEKDGWMQREGVRERVYEEKDPGPEDRLQFVPYGGVCDTAFRLTHKTVRKWCGIQVLLASEIESDQQRKKCKRARERRKIEQVHRWTNIPGREADGTTMRRLSVANTTNLPTWRRICDASHFTSNLSEP